MGTSAPSDGPKNNTPLVPSWLPDRVPTPSPPPDDAGDDSDGNQPPPDAPKPQAQPPRPAIQEPPQPQRFRNPRANFTKFAKSGGRDSDACRRAVGSYVRSGAGGSRNATSKMGGSRTTAGNILHMFQGIQNNGLNETLKSLNLTALSGKTPSEICTGLTEIICQGQEGGPIDEAIARDAWLDTITVLSDLGITDLESLTAEQMEAVFVEFITHSVQGRIMQDIGSQSLKVADNVASVENLEEQLHDYIQNSVNDSLATDFKDLTNWNEKDISGVVDKTYQDTFSLLEDREGDKS